MRTVNPNHIVYEVSHKGSPIYVGITRTQPGSRAHKEAALVRFKSHLSQARNGRDTPFCQLLLNTPDSDLKISVLRSSKDREEILLFERARIKHFLSQGVMLLNVKHNS